MSFSWWCRNKAGEDLFEEFEINGQALGLADNDCPHQVDDIRHAWCGIGYKDKLADAAQDAVRHAQSMVAANLVYRTEPMHRSECPTCTCPPRPTPEFFGADVEQMRRFLSIPLDRVWRAGGGY